MTPDHLGPRPPKTGQMLFAVHAFPLEGRLANIHVRRGHHTPVVSTRLNFPLFRKQDRQVVVLHDIAILPHLWFYTLLYWFLGPSPCCFTMFHHVSSCRYSLPEGADNCYSPGLLATLVAWGAWGAWGAHLPEMGWVEPTHCQHIDHGYHGFPVFQWFSLKFGFHGNRGC